MLSADVCSQDIHHARLVEHERTPEWIKLFTALKDQVEYPLKALVADSDPAIPHQFYVLHYERGLKGFLNYRFIQRPGYWWEAVRFWEAVHRLLYMADFDAAIQNRNDMEYDPGFRRAGLDEPISNLKWSPITTCPANINVSSI